MPITQLDFMGIFIKLLNMQSNMFLQSVSRTHPGKVRQNNEDCIAIMDDRGFFAIADGMGGHAFGQVASQLAIDACVDYISTLSNQPVIESESELATAVSFANEAIITIQQNEKKYQNMGTTLTCACLCKTNIHFSWVGDSRLYLFRSSESSIEMLTRDHTLDRKKIDARLAPELYKRAPNILTQKVGSILLLKPDTGSVVVGPNDILLACTDGLTDKVDDQWILDCISNFQTDLNQCADRLIERALDCGGHDNISLILSAVSGQ